MADQWAELFGPAGVPATQPTGAAPKETTAKTTAPTPKPNPLATPQGVVQETTGDDDFDAFLSGTDNAGDSDDAPGNAATTAQAKQTLSSILTEEKKPENGGEAPKKQGRGRPAGSKNADKPLTAEQFVDKMKPENAEGNRTPEETFRPELGAPVATGTTPDEQDVARAITTRARYIASAIRAGF